MTRRYTDIAFTDSVKATQTRNGTRHNAQKVENWDVDDSHFSPREAEFIAERDSFYMASVGEDGWPYVQFRGGPPGFLKLLSDNRFGFADFRGNLQYISTGNIAHDDRVALFLMDYPNKRRLKIMARARVVDAAADPDLIEELAVQGYKAKVERAVVFTLEAYDWNCSQHITPRYNEAEWSAMGGGPVQSVDAACQDGPAGNGV